MGDVARPPIRWMLEKPEEHEVGDLIDGLIYFVGGERHRAVLQYWDFAFFKWTEVPVEFKYHQEEP